MLGHAGPEIGPGGAERQAACERQSGLSYAYGLPDRYPIVFV